MENLQDKLQEKYNEVEAAILELEKVKNENYKTSGIFRYNPTNEYSWFDITSTTNEVELIHIHAFIFNKAKQYNDSAESIGLSQYPVFKWCGYAAQDWIDDINLRFKLIKFNGRLELLKEAKAKMLPYLPQENKIKQLLLSLGV